MTATPAPDLSDLAGLCGLRSAPELDGALRQHLRSQLQERLAACTWFTVGIMAGSAEAAVAALRATEQALAWTPLAADLAGPAPEMVEGPVFLKGNQRNGRFLLRAEAGLGEGILITGHNPEDPAVEDTWGPLPLDFFGV
ncbi:DUF1824 family protein [Cyanobium sp. FGCU-52]|nr:DUF1824 family protein [Cyanobium sp. FGCU52]